MILGLNRMNFQMSSPNHCFDFFFFFWFIASLLCQTFTNCHEQGLLSHCSTSHYAGFSLLWSFVAAHGLRCVGFSSCSSQSPGCWVLRHRLSSSSQNGSFSRSAGSFSHAFPTLLLNLYYTPAQFYARLCYQLWIQNFYTKFLVARCFFCLCWKSNLHFSYCPCFLYGLLEKDNDL